MRRLSILVLALGSCAKSADGPPPAARKPRVAVHEVAAKEILYTILATGAIEASEEISVPARVSGTIDDVHFTEGDDVGPDKVLLEIDLARYRLGKERAAADHTRAKAQRDLAETLYKNRLKLYEEGKRQEKQWVTDEQMAGWKADLDKAEADLERARVDLELAKRNHEDASVRPPLAGVIHSKKVSKGEYVKAETVVATILRVDPLYVRFTVPELEASRLRKDQEIGFAVRGEPGQWFRAKLFYIAQKADETTRAVECKARVLDKSEKFRAGYFAQVKIVTAREKNVVVPERAVLPTDRGFIVFVVDEKNKVSSKVVRLGLRTDGEVEVLEGLTAGDKIVVDGGSGLRPNMEVEPVPPGGK